jgi:hypothetical protein
MVDGQIAESATRLLWSYSARLLGSLADRVFLRRYMVLLEERVLNESVLAARPDEVCNPNELTRSTDASDTARTPPQGG